jgi:hypothetical protein
MEKGIAALDDLLDEMDYISQPTTLCWTLPVSLSTSNSMWGLSGNMNILTDSGESSRTAAPAVVPPGGTYSNVWLSVEFI